MGHASPGFLVGNIWLEKTLSFGLEFFEVSAEFATSFAGLSARGSVGGGYWTEWAKLQESMREVKVVWVMLLRWFCDTG